MGSNFNEEEPEKSTIRMEESENSIKKRKFKKILRGNFPEIYLISIINSIFWGKNCYNRESNPRTE